MPEHVDLTLGQRLLRVKPSRSSGVAQTRTLACCGIVSLIVRTARRRIANQQHLTAFPAGTRLPDRFIGALTSESTTAWTGTICGAHICIVQNPVSKWASIDRPLTSLPALGLFGHRRPDSKWAVTNLSNFVSSQCSSVLFMPKTGRALPH